MSLCDIYCGSVATENSINSLADRTARAVLLFDSPRAVCMAPDGALSVESPDTALEDDLVGVYRPEEGILGLTRLIRDDIAEEAVRRRLRKANRPAYTRGPLFAAVL